MSAPWTKLPPLDGRSNPCLCCPPIPARAPMEKVIGVGFGTATVECGGEVVADGEHSDEWLTFADAERLAAEEPDHDWRVVLFGPLHGETYQRHAAGEWVLVASNEGFA